MKWMGLVLSIFAIGCQAAIDSAARQSPTSVVSCNETAALAEPALLGENASPGQRDASTDSGDARPDSTNRRDVPGVAQPNQAIPPRQLSDSQPLRPPERLPPLAGFALRREAAAESVSFVVRAPEAEISLPEAVWASLARNPDLVAIRGNRQVSLAAYRVARTYPYNPTVGVEYLPFAREANGQKASALIVATVQETFELAHQRRYRDRTGAAEARLTDRNVARAEMLNVAQTERLFFTALYQRQQRALADKSAEVNERLRGVLQRSFDAGQTPPADAMLARLEAGTSRQQADRASVAYATALANLRTQLGCREGPPLLPAGDLLAWRWLPAGSVLDHGCGPVSAEPTGASLGEATLAQLVKRRPDVMAAQADREAARSRFDLARASRVPNINFGPFYEQTESNAHLFGFQAQRELAIINNGAALEQQRDAEFRQKAAALEQLETKTRLEIQGALDRYERARTLMEPSRNALLKRLPDDIQLMEDLYQAGQVDLPHVLAARARMLQMENGYLDSANELAQAAADLTAATGIPAEALLSPAESEPR